MQFGKLGVSLSRFKQNQSKQFYALLDSVKYRGDYKSAWDVYRKEARKASKKKK